MENALTVPRLVSFLKSNLQYVAVLFIFLCVGLYQYIDIQKESKKESEDEKIITETPTLDSKNTEKVFSDILQSKQGDVFRVGFVARVDYRQSIDILLRSPMFKTLKIGQINIDPSSEGVYQELIFSTPGRYDSIILKLKNNGSDEKDWDNGVVFVNSLFVSRLDIHQTGISLILPTLYGVEGVKNARLEDIGEAMQYTFSLQKNKSDYESLYDSTAGVQFDEKESALVGQKKNGEFFTFKFDTIDPFKEFTVHALRRGVSQDEIRFEYSLDNFFWRDVPATVLSSGQQEFLFSIPGDRKSSAVYVRVLYVGEEKKVGTFALEELSTIATVEKTHKR